MSSNALPVAPFEFVQQGDFQDNFTYEVPASGEVQPYTSTATFTNGSGQAIQPTISIYSAEGNLLARVFPVAAIADGDDAEVTWMPPFGSAASAASPTPVGLGDYVAAESVGSGPRQAVVNNANPVAAVFNNGVQAGGAGSVTLNADETTINLKYPGHYQIDFNYVLGYTAQDGVGNGSASLLTATNEVSDAVETYQSFPTQNTTSETAGIYSWLAAFSANGSLTVGIQLNGGTSDGILIFGQIKVTFVQPLGS